MYRIYSEDGSYKYGYAQHFIVDTKEDLNEILSTMPDLNMGSMAFCIGDMKFYILNGEDQWIELEF